MFGSVLDPERVFDSMWAMDRTRVRRRRLTIGLTAAIVAGAWAGPFVDVVRGDPEPAPVASIGYVVREGDTLWSIVETLRPGQDPRPGVDAILAANHLETRALVPGQVLLVPTSS